MTSCPHVDKTAGFPAPGADNPNGNLPSLADVQPAARLDESRVNIRRLAIVWRKDSRLRVGQYHSDVSSESSTNMIITTQAHAQRTQRTVRVNPL